MTAAALKESLGDGSGQMVFRPQNQFARHGLSSRRNLSRR